MLVKFERHTGQALFHVANNMRQSDVDEIKASSGGEPLSTLVKSIQISDFITVPTIHGEPIAVFGLSVQNILPSIGVPWLLGTDLIDKYPKDYFKAGKIVVQEMKKICPTMINFVHSKNKTSVSFLKRLGFTIHEPVPFGVSGELFHKFIMGEI